MHIMYKRGMLSMDINKLSHYRWSNLPASGRAGEDRGGDGMVTAEGGKASSHPGKYFSLFLTVA